MSNPLFNEERWNQAGTAALSSTVNGTVIKTGILLGVLLLVFGATWDSIRQTSLIFGMQVGLTLMVSGIASLVLALVGMFIPRAAMFVGLLYVVANGVLLGGISYMFNEQYHGLPLLAAALTIGTVMSMLLLYTQRIIRASPMFIKVVIGATLGLAIGMGLLWILSMFGMATGIRESLYGSGWVGIGFSLFCVVLAAFNLVLDFHFIEQAQAKKLPKYMEWVGAFALVVTIIWLYIEFLRLLAKLKQR